MRWCMRAGALSPSEARRAIYAEPQRTIAAKTARESATTERNRRKRQKKALRK